VGDHQHAAPLAEGPQAVEQLGFGFGVERLFGGRGSILGTLIGALIVGLFRNGLALSGVTALIDEWTRPPFEWQETKDDDLLRRKSDGTND